MSSPDPYGTRVLRDERGPRDSRQLEVTFSESGLRVDGWDLGDSVESFHGAGIREYEWIVDVATSDLPALRAHLGLTATEPLLDALERVGASAVDLGARAVKHTVVWSRLGD